MKSIIYSHPIIYKTALKLIYGKEYKKRYRIIAEEIKGRQVLDLCCGDCKLSEFVPNYKGIDLNRMFISYAKKKGIDAERQDILKKPIPRSDCIVMQGSLYHFIPDHEKLLKNMLKSSNKLIISEPWNNLSQSKNRIISGIAKKLSKVSGSDDKRFTKQDLIALFEKYKANRIIVMNKDIIGVFGK